MRRAAGRLGTEQVAEDAGRLEFFEEAQRQIREREIAEEARRYQTGFALLLLDLDRRSTLPAALATWLPQPPRAALAA
ncbi:MAG TPA: hypothetical protein VKV73_28020 [Chloroflexota bacterium]|nr:hypothetical protein [Chloroflexota bacterium]